MSDENIVKVSLVDLRGKLAEYINQVTYQNKTVIITRHGKAAAALVSLDKIKYRRRKK